MVVIIGNQKGGAGKSTLTLLLANYLTMVQNCKVTVLDMDYQQSIYTKFQKAKIVDNAPIYEVIAVDLSQFSLLHAMLTKNKEQIILIDLPGKMDDDLLIPVIKSGEAILSPFNYDQFSVDSTVLFAMVTQQINPKAPILFIPNRIKNTVRYDTLTEVNKVLEKFGRVIHPLAERIDFQRMETFYFPPILLPAILPTLELLYEILLNTYRNE